jgi:hypothetical protein
MNIEQYNGNIMKKYCLILFTAFVSGALHAQAAGTTQPVPNLAASLESLLNKPALIKPAVATPLGKNWFRLETDAHVITDEVNAKQIAAVLLDTENQAKYYNGKKSKLTAKVVGPGASGGTIADFVSISIAGPFQIKTPYRALILPIVNTASKIALEVRQIPEDSAANSDIKNLFATRYAEDITINGKQYTYIRFYTIDEVNASILPGAKGTLENNSTPVNVENLQMIIAGAKTK